jgi:hypothetical protein
MTPEEVRRVVEEAATGAPDWQTVGINANHQRGPRGPLGAGSSPRSRRIESPSVLCAPPACSSGGVGADKSLRALSRRLPLATFTRVTHQ